MAPADKVVEMLARDVAGMQHATALTRIIDGFAATLAVNVLANIS